MAFADHYSRDDLDRTIRRTDGRDGGNVDGVLKPAIEAHLADLVAAGRLGRITGLKGRRVRVADAWNGLLGDKVEDFEWALANKLCSTPVHVSIGVRFQRADKDWDRALDDTEIDETYARLCRMMDDGVLQQDHRCILDELQDAITGDSLRIEVTDWQPTLLRLDRKNGYEWVPAVDAALPELVAAEIAMPTGDLLLSDWLHVDGFTKATDAIEKDVEGSICDDAGQAEMAKALAKAGVGYAQTDNTTVAVFRRIDGRAIAILDDYAPRRESGITLASDQWEKVGTFGCDVWRVTALDIASAVELATRGGNEDAAADIERHLALASKPSRWQNGTSKEWRQWGMAAHSEHCSSKNVLRLSVEPGVWTMRCGSDFSKRFKRKTVGLPRGGKLWCVIEFARAADADEAFDQTIAA